MEALVCAINAKILPRTVVFPANVCKRGDRPSLGQFSIVRNFGTRVRDCYLNQGKVGALGATIRILKEMRFTVILNLKSFPPLLSLFFVRGASATRITLSE